MPWTRTRVSGWIQCPGAAVQKKGIAFWHSKTAEVGGPRRRNLRRYVSPFY
ncbi:MAG TPA: hypothetical protein VJV97_05820 [Gemmatimonadaceae bacterium]|nr:hypothetical protein [Gemmatimonadaceae bacterium]